MTYIADLIKEHCPNGVEWKELGDREVAKLSRGKVMSKQFLEENKGVFSVYSSQTANSGEIGKISTFDFDGEYITWTTDGANAGTVFYRKGKFSITNVCGLVDIQNDKLLTKFVYYYLTITTKKYVSSGMGNPKLMSNVMAKIKIPIPPLKIQEEIVQILDKFTEYVTELTAELTDRQKQYTYYRDKLLSFEDEIYQVEWKTLGEVAKSTQNISWKEQENKSFSYIDLSSVDRESKKIVETTEITKETAPSRAQRIIKKDDIIFGTTRPTLRRYTKVTQEFDNQICSTGFYVFRASDEVLPNYVYHIFASYDFNKYVEENQSGASYPAISNTLIEQYKLPVPPLDIQSRIVQVLDNFDTVCNDLNIGLPKEIELRQKQYEYFRDKLFTFTAEGVYTGQWTVDSEWGSSDLIRLLQWVFGTIQIELGTICTFTRGNGLQKKDFTEEGYPVIHYGQIYTRYGFSTDKTISFTDQSVFAKLKKAQPGDIVMATTSENVEDVGKAVVWEGNVEVGISGDAYIAKTTQHSRFLNYFFKSIHFQGQKEKKVTGTKVIRINAKDMEKFIIVLPSLEDQTRIVAILDKFNELTTSISQGLPKEIELRQKQYEYFRDQLLNFSSKHE